MKTRTPNQKQLTGLAAFSFLIALGMTAMSLTAAAQSGSGGVSGSGSKLSFRNPTLKSGTAGAVGAVYKFRDVDENLDALIKIKSTSDKYVYLVTIDMTSSGFDHAWQPQVGYDKQKKSKAKEWFMEFEVQFVKKGTSTPALLNEINVSAIDIDGNGAHLAEFVEFDSPDSYKIEEKSLLKVTKIDNLINGIKKTTGVRLEGPKKTYENIDTSKTDVMVTAKYLQSQLFTVRLGAATKSSSASDERMYSMYFQDFKYTQPSHATLPVNLKNFDARVNNSKVALQWSTADEVNFSHFLLQRSTDGKEFANVTMIMSNSHSLDYSYGYTESFNQNAPAILYYRLKMVDIDGTFKYSNIRVVKMNGFSSQLTVSTYPNPVTSELRITIPANWQNHEVSYDVVNLNGNIVKHKVANNASQTETFQVNDLKAGVYVIRLKSGSESAVQQVVKK